MKKFLTIAAPAVIVSILALSACTQAHDHHKGSSNSTATESISSSDVDNLVAQGVPKPAITMAMKAYNWAVKQGKVTNKRYLTVVDFDQPSTEKRLYVIDLDAKKVIFNELVSQGAGSGKGNMATHFSDAPDSHSSVLGVLVTDSKYVGKHGQSLRLSGLEDINKKALSRDIVVHPAPYATPSFAKEHGYLGHSWGCFAVSPSVSKPIINTIGGGTVVFAYASQLDNDNNYS